MFTSSAGHVNCWNVANAGLYALNVLVFFLASLDTVVLLPGNPKEVLFDRYRTLITPGEVSLLIVPVILLFEGVFIFFQLVPWYRNNRFVELITPWWIAISFLQIQWIVELARGDTGTIAIAMVTCLAMLAIMLGMILVLDARKPSFFEFWFLRAPFSIHAGWLIVACALNVNVWVASQTDFDNSQKFAIAMISLAIIFMLTALWAVNTRRPDPLICAPVAYCLYYVWLNQEQRPDNMPTEMIKSTEIACAHCFTGVLALGVMAFLTRFSMVCVSNRLPQAYAEGGLEEAGKSIVI